MPKREPPSLECSALILNINYGKNQELLSRCKPLLDYSRFIYYTREYMSEGKQPERAVDLAVDRCLQEGTDRINRLVEYLVRDNRMDELVRSCKDRKLQEELLKEYQL